MRGAQCWLFFYEYACDCNMRVTDEEKIESMRMLPGGVVKKWYVLCAFSSEWDSGPE